MGIYTETDIYWSARTIQGQRASVCHWRIGWPDTMAKSLSISEFIENLQGIAKNTGFEINRLYVHVDPR
jgi:hypothetical protein